MPTTERFTSIKNRSAFILGICWIQKTLAVGHFHETISREQKSF